MNDCGEKCIYNEIHENAIVELKESVKVLLEGQRHMSEAIVQLTTSLKSIDRLERKIDKLEEHQREEIDKQEVKIEKLSAMVYKAGGAVAAVVIIIQAAIGLIK